MAVYNGTLYDNSKKGLIEINGDIKMGNIYYLKTNETKQLLYLTDKTNETNTWNHTEPVRIKNGEQKEKQLSIKIEDQRFFDFFLVSRKGVGDMTQIDTNCEIEKDDLKMLNYSISKTNKTLWLYLNQDFDYNQDYCFTMGIEKLILYSTLTLRFNITKIKIQKESLKEQNSITKHHWLSELPLPFAY